MAGLDFFACGHGPWFDKVHISVKVGQAKIGVLFCFQIG
jgi:hypothetical protein